MAKTTDNPLLRSIENSILEQASALGNTRKNLAKVASDLLNTEGRHRSSIIAADCFLSKVTVVRIMIEGGEPTYSPRADTLERIFRYFGAEIYFRKVRISANNQNQPRL